MRNIVWLERSSQMKSPIISSGIESATFQLAAKCLNQLCYNVPLNITGYTQKNGAVSKVHKKFISQLKCSQCTPSEVATLQVSHTLITNLQCMHPWVTRHIFTQ
jgi:hypothetical protein